jgi:formylglycine-generating enzyme required for sulfatase activity/tRNA A-37 threonylcarbamoyl transferase component Bud32
MVFGHDFRVVRALRAGGMGAVYVVDQLSTGKQRALKVMAPELATDAVTRERFVREASAASKIESDHVVEVVTAGIDDATGAPYIVMELLRGEELADVAARIGPMPLGDVAEVLAQVGHALEQAHAQGIVHRDLKPENIFLALSKRRDASFTAKVIDFGIAKLVADSQGTGTQPLGTPLFMSPEQTDRRGKISPATDVWALGLITFKLITAKDFWLEAQGDGSLPVLLREIVLNPIPFASVRARELGVEALLPTGFDAWFARCVNHKIEARFPEAGEAVRAFAEIVPHDAARSTALVQAGTLDAGTSSGVTPPALTPSAKVTPPSGTTPSVKPSPSGSTQSSGPDVLGPTAVLGSRASTASPVSTSGPAGQPVAAPAAGGAGGGAGRLALVGALVAVLVGGGAWFALRSPASSGSPAPSTSSTTSPSSAPSGSALAVTAAPPTCPSAMLFRPGGDTFVGDRDLPPTALAVPTHNVTLSAFCLDKTEVTTKAYNECSERGACERALDHVTWPGITPDEKKAYSPFCNGSHPERGDHPINCVAWSMAATYCAKRGARLPTEAEWEYAARGSKQRTYPWGDDPPSAKLLNACGRECAKWSKETLGKAMSTMYAEDDGFAGTAPVGSFPAGASEHGFLDLAGNVWEWTSDWYAPYDAKPAVDPKGPETGKSRVVRGGDFLGSDADWARPAWRFTMDPEAYNHAVGFRCAATPK